ncbi:S8 family serine peptidase [Parapusillimonas granuli]|uniref:S8 family serine peptidase n=1 Tax=Parapusillimonas granuli TaxID=380911 RepID=A0A853G361_9BURK|nr:S8 family serine peptidase [Parapusillimonas granuli]MBB5216028.1 subtilisin-like proprotein convertase family protein [Parapusillimonas granuli]NYT50677.1 S8 family serine peptidase [Parapusillimonas granuli]
MKKTSWTPPSDPLFPMQWHLHNTGTFPGSVAGFDINVLPVWPDYTGRGVIVGIMDDGMDETHPDLVHNYRRDLSWDVALDIPGAAVRQPGDEHGVAVTGLVAASANNGIGGVGVAWDAQIAAYRSLLLLTDTEPLLSFTRAAAKMIDGGISVSVNSWGAMRWPFDKHAQQAAYWEPARAMAEDGRDGLGIVTFFAAGNDRLDKFNTNYDPTDNIPWAIIVAASNQRGDIAVYSTPGASVLVTAPGSEPSAMVTTDRQGTDGYNKASGTAGDYTDRGDSFFNGTSAATPVAGGVAALMLQANPRLGYRDVQEILAYSSKRADFLDRGLDAAFNGARDWNGGALLGSHDFGFGHLDAHAAVRLAESWNKTSTYANLLLEQGSVAQHSLTIEAGQVQQASAYFARDHRVEQVTVTVDIEAPRLQHVVLELVSPDGTVSTLINRPPVYVPDDDDDGSVPDPELPAALNYTLNTVRNWGEDLNGEWTLRIRNDAGGETVRLKDWSILAYTAGQTTGGSQIFTDEFARFAELQSGRATLDPSNGTTLNAAAVTSDVRFDLTTGISWLGDADLKLADPSGFRGLTSGDGDDILIGNGLDNILMAGRGNNHIDGAAGVDVVRLIGAKSDFSIARHENAISLQSLALSGGGTDVLYNVELLHFADQVVLSKQPSNLGPDLFDETGYLEQNPDVAAAVWAGHLSSGAEHYRQWGASEGRSPNALFNEKWYLAQNPDVAGALALGWLHSGYQHYQEYGWTEGRAPSAWMDGAGYLAKYTDVAEARLDPLAHYLLYGVNEGRTIAALDAGLWGV